MAHEDPPRLPRISILLTALAFGGFGILLLIAPQVLGTVGVEIARPAGAAELRAFYGGLELGIAAFFFLALARPAWHRAALNLQVLGLGGVAIARAIGVLLGGGEGLIYLLLAAEAGGALVGMLALRSLDAAKRD